MPEESQSWCGRSLMRCGKRRIAFSAGCFARRGSLHGAVAGAVGDVGGRGLSLDGPGRGERATSLVATPAYPDAGALLSPVRPHAVVVEHVADPNGRTAMQRGLALAQMPGHRRSL